MSALIQTLAPWIDVLGHSLLHFLWQGVAIGLVYWPLRALCTNVGARYRLGMGTLLLLFTCPFATMIWLLPDAGAADDAATSRILGDAADAVTSAWVPGWSWDRLCLWFVAFWLAGVCLIAMRSFLHWRRLARVVREAVALPRDWQLRLLRLQQNFGVVRPVRLLSSVQIVTPTLIGWLKPAILLPACVLSGFTPAQIEFIIAHELSHVRRFDYLANLVQIAVETLLFYHPVVYWIGRDVRQARESCCDDLVLAIGGGERIAYARTLAELEELHQRESVRDFGPAVTALGAGGGVLFARIRRIVDPTHAYAIEAMPRSPNLTLPALLALAALVLVSMRLHWLPALSEAALQQTVLQVSARSAAMINGASQLAAERIFAQVYAPDRQIQPQQTPARVTEIAKYRSATVSEIEVPGPVRPRIALAPPDEFDGGVVNLPAQLDLPRQVPVAVTSLIDEALPVPSRTAAVTSPAPSQVVPARYPSEALQNRVTGKVDLDFRIAADGSVRDIRVLQAQPRGVFEQAAVAALRQWRFNPSDSDPDARYARSFSFARPDATTETCREVTGTHICRRATREN